MNNILVAGAIFLFSSIPPFLGLVSCVCMFVAVEKWIKHSSMVLLFWFSVCNSPWVMPQLSVNCGVSENNSSCFIFRLFSVHNMTFCSDTLFLSHWGWMPRSLRQSTLTAWVNAKDKRGRADCYFCFPQRVVRPPTVTSTERLTPDPPAVIRSNILFVQILEDGGFVQ